MGHVCHLEASVRVFGTCVLERGRLATSNILKCLLAGKSLKCRTQRSSNPRCSNFSKLVVLTRRRTRRAELFGVFWVIALPSPFSVHMRRFARLGAWQFD